MRGYGILLITGCSTHVCLRIVVSRKPSPKGRGRNQIEPDLIVIDLNSGFGRDAQFGSLLNALRNLGEYSDADVNWNYVAAQAGECTREPNRT